MLLLKLEGTPHAHAGPAGVGRRHSARRAVPVAGCWRRSGGGWPRGAVEAAGRRGLPTRPSPLPVGVGDAGRPPARLHAPPVGPLGTVAPRRQASRAGTVPPAAPRVRRYAWAGAPGRDHSSGASPSEGVQDAPRCYRAPAMTLCREDATEHRRPVGDYALLQSTNL